MAIETRAVGGGRYRLDHPAADPDGHVQEREAIAAASVLLDADSALGEVRIRHDYELVVTRAPDVSPAPVPEPEPSPEGDGVLRFQFGGAKNVQRVTVPALGGEVLRFLFMGSADRDAHAQIDLWLSDGVRELWLEYGIYFPDGTIPELGPRYVHRDPGDVGTNNKFLALWGGDYGAAQSGGAWVGYAARRMGVERSYFEMLHTERDGGPVYAALMDPVEATLTAAQLGRWLQLRAHFRLGEDGAAEATLDGVPIGAYRGPVGSPDPARDFLDRGYLGGWANSGYTEDTYVYMRGLRMYVRDPGW